MKNIHDNYSPHFYNWSHGCNWVFITPFFHYTFHVFSKHFRWLWFSTWGVTQIFIPEESQPLVVLPELGHNFPLTLIPGHGTKRHPNGSPVFQKSYLHCTVQPNFLLIIRLDPPSQQNDSLLSLLIQKQEDPKVARWRSSFPV